MKEIRKKPRESEKWFRKRKEKLKKNSKRKKSKKRRNPQSFWKKWWKKLFVKLKGFLSQYETFKIQKTPRGPGVLRRFLTFDFGNPSPLFFREIRDKCALYFYQKISFVSMKESFCFLIFTPLPWNIPLNSQQSTLPRYPQETIWYYNKSFLFLSPEGG